MASKESAALSELYVKWGEETASNADAKVNPLAIMRYQHNDWDSLATEPEGVSYRSVSSAAVPGLLAEPTDPADSAIVLYLHGGGYVSGSTRGHRKLIGHLAKAAGVRVFAIDYRLAPEHPYPAQLEDALAAFDGMVEAGHAPGSIVLAGDSAGGALSTALALRLRDLGRELPAAIVTLSPYYDLEAKGDAFEVNDENDVMGNKEGTVQLNQLFLGETPIEDPYVNPLRSDPTGLPPIFISFGGHEVLMDGGTMFAALAKSKGVEVVSEIQPGQQHVFHVMAGSSPEADDSIRAAAAFIRTHLGLS